MFAGALRLMAGQSPPERVPRHHPRSAQVAGRVFFWEYATTCRITRPGAILMKDAKPIQLPTFTRREFLRAAGLTAAGAALAACNAPTAIPTARAGNIFGTGGPRAFQLGARLSF